jgi:hypothetical protein
MKTRKLKAPGYVTDNALRLADEILEAMPAVAMEQSGTTFLLTAIAYALLGIGEELEKERKGKAA